MKMGHFIIDPLWFGDAARGEEDSTDQASLPGTNTTLVVVGTDLPLSRVELGRMAKMASGAFSRAISPVNTPFDGDILFALSSGMEPEPLSPGEMLALSVVVRELVEEAIRRAVLPWPGEGGEPA